MSETILEFSSAKEGLDFFANEVMNENAEAIRADERAKVEREWQERVQKLHRRAQAAESEVSRLEYLRALLDTTATEQVRRLHKHSQALWSACERQKAEQAALMEKVKPILSTIANAKRDVYGSAPTLWVFDDAQETAREVLAAMDAGAQGEDATVTQVSQRDFESLLNTIENPPEPNEKLKELMKKYPRGK